MTTVQIRRPAGSRPQTPVDTRTPSGRVLPF